MELFLALYGRSSSNYVNVLPPDALIIDERPIIYNIARIPKYHVPKHTKILVYNKKASKYKKRTKKYMHP